MKVATKSKAAPALRKAATVTHWEKAVLRMLRDLDVRQRDEIVKELRVAVLANKVTMRIASMKKMRTVTNRTVDKAFGAAPWWRARAYIKEARHG